MKKTVIAVTCISVLCLAGCKAAEPNRDAAAATETETVNADRNAPQKAYDEANAKMHAGMGHVDPDPDIAFMQGMVPHHQGAVDMAEIVLKYGKDPEARALAETIIESQVKEIEQMNAWLKKRGVEDAKPSLVDHGAMGH